MQPEPFAEGLRFGPPITPRIATAATPSGPDFQVLITMRDSEVRTSVLKEFLVRRWPAFATSRPDATLRHLTLHSYSGRRQVVLITDDLPLIHTCRSRFKRDLFIAFVCSGCSEAELQTAIDNGADWATDDPLDPAEFFGYDAKAP